jgi:hypothetical protein
MARAIIAARLSTKLEPVLEARDAAALTRFTQTLTKAWISMFKAQVIIVWDAGSTGDQIIDQCARAVPPGVHVTIMGTQNIKGTGLDFIYRWLALDAVYIGLNKLASSDEHTRLEALRSLDAHSDFGFTDTGLLVARLPDYDGGSAQETSLRKVFYARAKGGWLGKVLKSKLTVRRKGERELGEFFGIHHWRRQQDVIVTRVHVATNLAVFVGVARLVEIEAHERRTVALGKHDFEVVGPQRHDLLAGLLASAGALQRDREV